MALHILYPNGTTAKLCECRCIYQLNDGRHEAYTVAKDKGGEFIARIPADCVVSFHHFNRVEATTTSTDLTKQNAIRIVNATVKTMRGWNDRALLTELKRTLKNFDARTQTWK